MIRVLVLWLQTMHAYPYMAPERAAELVAAAVDVETPEVGAELLIAMARVESHHDPCSVSRVAGGRRVTGGRWCARRGRGWSGPYFCGVIQARAETWDRCVELQDVHEGLAAGVLELQRWHRKARGDVRRMLAGHGCGSKMSLRCGARPAALGRRARPPYHARVLGQLERLTWEPRWGT